MTVLKNPSAFQIQEELQYFSTEVGGVSTVDETDTGHNRITVEVNESSVVLIRDGDNGVFRLEHPDDVESFDVADIDRLEFNPSTERVIVDMIDFGL